jgi:hypothetical protein
MSGETMTSAAFEPAAIEVNNRAADRDSAGRASLGIVSLRVLD